MKTLEQMINTFTQNEIVFSTNCTGGFSTSWPSVTLYSDDNGGFRGTVNPLGDRFKGHGGGFRFGGENFTTMSELESVWDEIRRFCEELEEKYGEREDRPFHKLAVWNEVGPKGCVTVVVSVDNDKTPMGELFSRDFIPHQ
jgi:hypothetical protein